MRGRKTTNRLRAIETRLLRLSRSRVLAVARQLIAFGRLKLTSPICHKAGRASRKTTNRLRAIETLPMFISIRVMVSRRKTTNRLRAIETRQLAPEIGVRDQVARQLIAFGRLKPCWGPRSGSRVVQVARQLIAFGRLKLLKPPTFAKPAPCRKTTNRLRAIETSTLYCLNLRQHGLSQDN